MSNKYDLSILIPARNEEFLARTVQDLLEHKRGKTEILVGLDGALANPSIPDHPDVTILYYPVSIGQRAITNQLCKLSNAKYIIKTDAHCSFEEGFDVKLMEAMEGHDDWVMVPIMRNLHAFDWVCPDGHRRYQGPSGPCKDCGKETTKDVVWIAKPSPQSTAYRFDTTLHFQYHNEYKKQQKGDLVESMSLQGSFFMMTRDKYWKLNVCDEAFGSWGQQGTEVACKFWLSGGRVVVNKKTWYAHMFRTQGGDFGFPYPQSGRQVEHARKYSRELFTQDKWDKAIHPFSWLIEKFKPLPDWHSGVGRNQKEDKRIEVPSADSKNIDINRSIIFYTDNKLNLKIAHVVQKNLKGCAEEKKLFIVSSSLKPMTFGDKNVITTGTRGYLTYFKQIVAALEVCTTPIIYMAEHDVLYHPSHFDFVPPTKDKFYYNHNVWRVRTTDGFAVKWDANQVAEMCCYRELALDFYRKRLKEFEADPEHFDRRFEPGGRDKNKYESWKSEYPNIDIRHGDNLTKSKWSIGDFRDKSTCVNWEEGTVDTIPGWRLRDVMKEMKLLN